MKRETPDEGLGFNFSAAVIVVIVQCPYLDNSLAKETTALDGRCKYPDGFLGVFGEVPEPHGHGKVEGCGTAGGRGERDRGLQVETGRLIAGVLNRDGDLPVTRSKPRKLKI